MDGDEIKLHPLSWTTDLNGWAMVNNEWLTDGNHEFTGNERRKPFRWVAPIMMACDLSLTA